MRKKVILPEPENEEKRLAREARERVEKTARELRRVGLAMKLACILVVAGIGYGGVRLFSAAHVDATKVKNAIEESRPLPVVMQA